MARPRRALHRAFARFLLVNKDRFAVQVRLGERTDKAWFFSFKNVSRLIHGWISTYEISVAVEPDGYFWDLIFTQDFGIRPVAGGVVCPHCLDVVPKIFPDREALWADHLFEPFLTWINESLVSAIWLELSGERGSMTTARLLPATPSRPRGTLVSIYARTDEPTQSWLPRDFSVASVCYRQGVLDFSKF